jgi:hypothetical protein
MPEHRACPPDRQQQANVSQKMHEEQLDRFVGRNSGVQDFRCADLP